MHSEDSSPQQPRDLRGTLIPCLDKGFVRLVDVMGDDNSIVQAARVSYGSGTKKVHQDRGLIRYLMRHAHTTPFEMVEFKFHVKLPIFVARQWIRHRTANVNEYSGRYSVMKDEFYLPDVEQIRTQSTVNKQGRSNEILPEDLANEIRNDMQESQRNSYEEYEQFLERDIAREISRVNLPLSLYTEWYWKIDLHNLFHFLRLRLDDHAQFEIRVYAEAMNEIVKEIVPFAWEAFCDYSLYAKRFSGPEMKIIKHLLEHGNAAAMTEDQMAEFGLSKREVREFKSKMDSILD